MRDSLPVRYMAISLDSDLKDEVAGGEDVMAGEAQLELDGASVGVGVGLDESVAACLHVAELTWGAERGRANEREGLVAAGSSIGIDGGQIDSVQPAVVYALEVGDQVVVAGADARFVEVLEHERVIAQPAAHAVEPSAANDSVVAAAAVQGVVACTSRQHVIAGVTRDHVVRAVAGAIDVGCAGQHQVLEIGGKREGNGAAHGIDAAVGSLGQGIGTVGDVSIITRTTDQCVVAGAAIERVIAGTSCQSIAAGVPGQRVVARSAGDVLHTQDRGKARAGVRRQVYAQVGYRPGVGQRVVATLKVGGDRLEVRERATLEGSERCAVEGDVERIATGCADDVERIDTSSAVDAVGSVAEIVDEGVVTVPAVQDILAAAAD